MAYGMALFRVREKYYSEAKVCRKVLKIPSGDSVRRGPNLRDGNSTYIFST